MAISNISVYQANDKYRATLRSTWISSPADTSLSVTAIPDNVPSIVVVGWETDYETVFTFTGTSGDSSSNYALTGVTRLKGANVDIPETTAVNCLNNEEFFNQYEDAINEVIDLANTLEKSTTTVESSATPTPVGSSYNNELYVTALAAAAELQEPSGTPANGNKLIVRIKDDGTARALTYDSIYTAIGVDLPTTTTISKTIYLGFIYNSTASEWQCVAVSEEA